MSTEDCIVLFYYFVVVVNETKCLNLGPQNISICVLELERKGLTFRNVFLEIRGRRRFFFQKVKYKIFIRDIRNLSVDVHTCMYENYTVF